MVYNVKMTTEKPQKVEDYLGKIIGAALLIYTIIRIFSGAIEKGGQKQVK